MSRQFLERCPKKHLLLHMDINKTIIQVDIVGGRSMEDVLISNAAANVVGKVDEAGRWRPLYGPKDPKPATADSSTMTYDVYLDRLHSEPPGMQDLPKKERDAVWKSVTGRRKEASHKFTFPGEIGERYAPLVEEQRRCLTVCQDPLQYYVIIPSFFHLINTLSTLDWPFTLLFRTFGSDLRDVLAEWQRFVRGEHVCKPSGPFLERLRAAGTEPLTGCMYRDGERYFLSRGPDVSVYTLDSTVLNGEHGASAEALKAELARMPGFKDVKETRFRELSGELQTYFAGSGHVGGLVDYYPAWAQVAERRVGGKVYPVSLDDDRYHVFFDDNIALGDEHSIVDLRDAATEKSILGVEEEAPFCVPVNAYEAIVDENYFVDRLSRCLELQVAAQQAHAQSK